MGFRVKIEANETIELGLEAVQSVTFITDTPNDSNARSTDLGMSMQNVFCRRTWIPLKMTK